MAVIFGPPAASLPAQTRPFGTAPGYWRDRLFHRREFHEPVTIVPLEINYGAGYFGGGGKSGDKMKSGWMKYSTSVPSFDGGSLNGRVFHALDLNMAKTNLSQYLLHASWLDLNTGLNFRYADMLYTSPLPIDEWGQITSTWNVGDKRFRPRQVGFGILNSLHLQWFESWFMTASYTYRLVSSKFYYTDGQPLDKKPSGWGTGISYSLGAYFILDPGLDNRFSIGIDLLHDYTKINRINDPGNLTPITRFDLRGFGIQLSLSAYYGGKRTIGDVAKSFYYRGDYIQARDRFAEFIKLYPEHSNRYRAKVFLDICNEKIPEQLFNEGKQFSAQGDWEKAVGRFTEAQSLTKNPELLKSIELHLNRIARLQMSEAETLLRGDRASEAYRVVLKTSNYSKEAERQINCYQAESLLQDATKALDYGLVYKALIQLKNAEGIYPPIKAKTSALKYRAATILIADANQVRSSEDMIFAVESLEKAREVAGSLGEKNEKVLAELKQRLAASNEQESILRIQKKMQVEREKIREILETRVEIGMTIPQVQDRLGEPARLFHEKSRKGEDIQLWQYYLENGKELYLTFREFILIKIEEM